MLRWQCFCNHPSIDDGTRQPKKRVVRYQKKGGMEPGGLSDMGGKEVGGVMEIG